MENENKFCPIIKNMCMKEKCMLYLTGVNECSVNWIAQSLDLLNDKYNGETE